MSKNKYKPHILIIPEDSANVSIVNGVMLSNNINARCVIVENPAGGYLKALAKYQEQIAFSMQKFDKRLVVLLIDFDGDATRLSKLADQLQPNDKDRVFILGVFNEPEDLKRAFPNQSLEALGTAMMDDCPAQMSAMWQHNLLQHNQDELGRLKNKINEMGGFLWH